MNGDFGNGALKYAGGFIRYFCTNGVIVGDDIISTRLVHRANDKVLLTRFLGSMVESFGAYDQYADLVVEAAEITEAWIDEKVGLINFLPETSQSVNISFSGTGLINNPEIEEVTLVAQETKAFSFSLNVSGSVDKYYQIKMDIKKQDTIYFTETLTVQVVAKFKIISASFPNTVTQWDYAHLIIIIKNNQDDAEDFTLTINGVVVSTNINKLVSGENRITASILSTLNPYEFGTKTYYIVLRDSSGELLKSYNFQLTIELSPLALFLCYILPISFPIGIILYYKNQDIKNKLLRR